MNIIYLASVVEYPAVERFGTGGATHVYEVAKNLTALGHHVHVICKRAAGDVQRQREVIDGISFDRIFSWDHRLYKFLSRRRSLWNFLKYGYYFFYSILKFFQVLRIVKEKKGDVIYERASPFNFSGLLTAMALKRPVVFEINDFAYSKLLLSGAQTIITPCKAMIPESARDKAVELQWGANTDLFSPDTPGADRLRGELGLTHKRVIIHVGSSIEWNGLKDIIESAGIVSRKFSDVIFLIVGGGNTPENLELVRSKGLTPLFHFTGYVDYAEIPRYLAMADIALAPYNSMLNREKNRALVASPLKIFEYMAAGKPLITTSIANGNGIIRPDETGIIIPPDSPDDLAGAIEHLLVDESLRRKLSCNARREIVERYSWRKHAQALEKVFSKKITSA